MSSQQPARFYLGLDTTHITDIEETLSNAIDASFDFITAPLMHPRFRNDDIGVSASRSGPTTRSDIVLPGRKWSTCVVGKMSTWLKLDSPDERIRLTSEKAFKEEIAWASHLSVPAIITPFPTFTCFNYARHLNAAVQPGSYLQVWVRVPLVSREVMVAHASPPLVPTPTPLPLVDRCRTSTWEAWNNLRSACNHHPSINVVLEMTADLPHPEDLLRWIGEPIKSVIIPTKIFLTNQRGYPTLTKRHQEFIGLLFSHDIQFVLSGRPRHKDGFLPYMQYLVHLQRTYAKSSQQSDFEAPYYDVLQMPLQPLMDNLESQTYETFEKDPIKYSQYEKAVTKCLLSLPIEKQIVLMVVGAGRGPLVRCSLRAAVAANRNIKVYAVEKNINAVITLRNMSLSEGWGGKVEIVSSDMRVWKAPVPADVLVSELLGSFGDNELSPECLDGAQRFLGPQGISIPANYTSFIAPITSSKLWNKVNNYRDPKNFETPYVVKFHKFKQLATSLPVFKFDHPNSANPIDNRRYVSLKWVIPSAATVHGFAGYFESQLFDDEYISINPQTFSTGMFSWFPIYFPIKEPMYVAEGQVIELHMWRIVSDNKVWYEWMVSSPVISHIHNPCGRSYFIGL